MYVTLILLPYIDNRFNQFNFNCLYNLYYNKATVRFKQCIFAICFQFLDYTSISVSMKRVIHGLPKCLWNRFQTMHRHTSMFIYKNRKGL